MGADVSARSQVASNVRKAVIRLWIDRPVAPFRRYDVLRKLDAVVYESVQMTIAQHQGKMLRLRIAYGDVHFGPGCPTPEGERWVTMAMTRLLPRLAEYIARARREGDSL